MAPLSLYPASSLFEAHGPVPAPSCFFKRKTPGLRRFSYPLPARIGYLLLVRAWQSITLFVAWLLRTLVICLISGRVLHRGLLALLNQLGSASVHCTKRQAPFSSGGMPPGRSLWAGGRELSRIILVGIQMLCAGRPSQLLSVYRLTGYRGLLALCCQALDTRA